MSGNTQVGWKRGDTGGGVFSDGEPPFLTLQVNEKEERDRDLELMRQIAAGNLTAFAQFYDRHSTFIYSVACGILHDASEAEDVCQETFVQIWEQARQFDPKLGKASSWTAALVRNKSIDRLRATRRRVDFAEKAGEEFSIEKISETVNDGVYGREKAALIQSAILDLPEEQRRAIELAFFTGLTQHEISEKLNTPLGTIKARIRRGLLKLRDHLGGIQ